MTRYAIVMSAENYKHFTPTKFTHADSERVYSTLTKMCDYPEQHAVIFKLAPDDAKAPIDILSEIRKMVLNSTDGDTILFYFAGHGHYYEGKTYLILPNTVPGAYETTALSLDDLSNELRVRERACFRILDACHSGLDVRDNDSQLNSHDFIRSVSHDASGWVTLAACKEDQFSISDPKIGHGLFTHYLCDEISGYKADEPIYPEILKVKIADKVLAHAKSLGYIQTPTINASISGNISIAIRRANITPSEEVKTSEGDTKSLDLRIARLKEVKDVLSNEQLDSILGIISNECLASFLRFNQLKFDVFLGPKIPADDIPKGMHSFIVNFAKKTNIQPRHKLERYEEEYEESPYGLWAAAGFYRKKRKQVDYFIRQPKEMPHSATILDLKGDNRCLPNIKILIYLIPLQITGCMLVSAFNCGWGNDEHAFDFIKNYYQILKPSDTTERIKEIGPFAAKEAMGKITDIVQQRVNLLERELSE